MQQQQQPEPGGIERLKMNVDRGRFVLGCVAITVEVFLHRGFGRRYLGIPAAVGAILIFLFMAFGAPHSPIPMMLYLLGYLLAVGAANAESRAAERDGILRHSRYTGESRLARFFPKLDELTVKQKVEPVFVAMVALMVMPFAPPFGVYLFFASGALAASVAQSLQYERAKASLAVDALIEARMHAARVRQQTAALLN